MNSTIKHIRVSPRAVNRKIFVLAEANIPEFNPLEGLKLMIIMLSFCVGCAKDAPNEGFDLYPHVDVIEYNEVVETINTDTNRTTFKYSNVTAATLEPDTAENATTAALLNHNAVANNINPRYISEKSVLQQRRSTPPTQAKDTTKGEAQSQSVKADKASAKAKKTTQKAEKSVKEGQKSAQDEKIFSVKKPVKTSENRSFTPKNGLEPQKTTTNGKKN